MNFLQICQMAARESGSIPPEQVTSVEGQTGRLAKLIYWVQEAYRQIELKRRDWLWKRDEFSQALVAGGTGRYTAASLGITRFGAWVQDDLVRTPNYFPMTIYLTATGTSDENYLRQMPWIDFRTTYLRGSQTNDRPQRWSISPAKEFCLGPVPNDAFTVRGEYYKGAQTLTENTSEPELPEEFHSMIAWEAVRLLELEGEAPEGRYILVRDEHQRYMTRLERDHLPEIILGGSPIA